MNKRFLALSLLLIGVVFCTACRNEAEDITYEPLELNFELEEGQSETGCYYGEEAIIFSVGERNERDEGPLVNTVSLILYDCANEKVVKEFLIDSEAYICSAIPYKDGILYLDYEGVFKDVTWSLVFVDEKGKKLIKKGVCSSYQHTPVLRLVDETPVFFWENREGEAAKCGLSKIVDDEIVDVFEREKQDNGISYFTTNGEKYLFLEGREYGTFVIGDMSGIKHEYALDKKIISFTMTKECIVCSLGEDDKYSLLEINLKNGKGKEVSMEKPLYRLESIGDNTCFGVYYDFESFMLNLKSDKLSEAPAPEGLEGSRSPRAYFRVSKDKGIVIFSLPGEKKDSYYMMTVN